MTSIKSSSCRLLASQKAASWRLPTRKNHREHRSRGRPPARGEERRGGCCRAARRRSGAEADRNQIEQARRQPGVERESMRPRRPEPCPVALVAVSAAPTTRRLGRLRPPLNLVCLSGEDTGSGIAQQHLRTCSSSFCTTKDFGEGTGLGLAVAYEGIVREPRRLNHVEASSRAHALLDLPPPAVDIHLISPVTPAGTGSPAPSKCRSVFRDRLPMGMSPSSIVLRNQVHAVLATRRFRSVRTDCATATCGTFWNCRTNPPRASASPSAPHVRQRVITPDFRSCSAKPGSIEMRHRSPSPRDLRMVWHDTSASLCPSGLCSPSPHALPVTSGQKSRHRPSNPWARFCSKRRPSRT